MGNFVITTDSTADLPASFLEEYGVKIVPLYYSMDDIIYGGEFQMSEKEFFDKMRSGSAATTMAANPDAAEAVLRAHLEEGMDILHISFSSALSSSYNSEVIAAKALIEEFPERKILVIDTLCASLGEGLVVCKAVKMQKDGKTMEEIAEWIENEKLHVCHLFTVDDLKYLARGGRISKTAALIGSLASVKPILHVDNEGKLVPLENVRGRKKAIAKLVDNMESAIKGYEDQNDTVAISHGDCPDEADLLASLVRERFGDREFIINCISPTVGAHSGPGTLALFFMGSPR
ncbi:DegV family protein [Parasporobacterium paucivorans]|uniref:EDD domain protein, DegV family n=1 Tax=Parasporobacterium paucivorans DSM 15970 TaxID=1122934 RepID=A0A1M6FKF5_9FIRM|nr:DegV family protein [Parasporobacterium paucivorans]SHI98200.1 EDD domain protein, DegV family [Parasporobacterium paucivorans DSM 15970]